MEKNLHELYRIAELLKMECVNYYEYANSNHDKIMLHELSEVVAHIPMHIHSKAYQKKVFRTLLRIAGKYKNYTYHTEYMIYVFNYKGYVIDLYLYN